MSDDGAVDQDYDDAVQVGAELADMQTEPVEGGIAIDLVTRQVLFVRQQVAADLEEYYEAESFDLSTYKQHPYLPVSVDDAVYEVAYLDGNPEQGWKFSKTYDMPRGRLMTVPVWTAWGED